MVNRLETYFDFAENDYDFFQKAYELNLVANQMGAIAQGICEKYLKHIIDVYTEADTRAELHDKENVLRTHNLERLYKYIRNYVPEIELDRNKLKAIDGYYFSTRYPGDDSVSIDADDLKYCKIAVEECRTKVCKYIKEHKTIERECEDISSLPQKPKK